METTNDCRELNRRAFLGRGAALAAGAVAYGGLTTPALAAAGRHGKGSGIGLVTTRHGKLLGVPAALPGVTVFKGIPYAGTTAGRHRWRAPSPAPSWSGVRHAHTYGDACPATTAGLPSWSVIPRMSEDCLNLNVWTGAASSRERRPVFVWIYGGRNTGMWAQQPIWDGSGLARKGLVVVTFNYRVGVFGGLATAELSKESAHDSSGNWALLDQLAALKWVHDNIAAFGGDPDRVTLAGWSHGASSTYDLIDSPLAKGLFQRAQMESGVQYTKDPNIAHVAGQYATLANAEAAGQEFADFLGARTAKELRALSVQALVAGENSPNAPSGSTNFGFVLDGYVMPRTYTETLRARAQNDMPVLTGNNAAENNYIIASQTTTVAAFQALVESNYTSMASELLAAYPASTDAEAKAMTNVLGQDDERISTYLWGTEWNAAGRHGAYTYYWNHTPPGTDRSNPIISPGNATSAYGPYHGSEMNYVFDNLWGTKRPWRPDDHRIADIVSDYVVKFATTGNPNDAGADPRPAVTKRTLPHWPRLTDGRPITMEIGDRFGVLPVGSTPARYRLLKRFFTSQTKAY